MHENDSHSDNEEPTKKKPKIPSIPNDIIKLSELVAEASVLIRLHRLLEAEVLYTEAITMQPENLHLYLCRSRCRIDSERYLLAIEDTNKILKVTPTNATAILIKANAYYYNGYFEESLIWYHSISGFIKIRGLAAKTIGRIHNWH
jgi:tetratricopeptide (TPR) repeat protein